jgi:hypothetical protein
VTLLIVCVCGIANPVSHEIGTSGAIQMMEQAETSSSSDISIPAIDKITPIRTETATFALG